MKTGDVGPLQIALLGHLAQVREECENGPVCRKPTCAEIAESLDTTTDRVQKAIERLRRRRADLAAYVRDGRDANRIIRHVYQPTPQGIVEAAKRSQSLLERAWRGSGLGELA